MSLPPPIPVSAQSPLTADLGTAQLDLDRARRCGYPEAIYAEGKSIEILLKLCDRLLLAGSEVLATRVSAEQAMAIAKTLPAARYNAVARTLRISPPKAGPDPSPRDELTKGRQGRVVIITAGTTDLPVAEEARETADWMGAGVSIIQDVGVAGPHRLPARLAEFENADAIVVVAGMEGALPSIVGGYVACPVIAVPTSVGYGASFGGLSALLGMLNSCAANVTVVNIDAGFKAGYVAALIANRSRATE